MKTDSTPADTPWPWSGEWDDATVALILVGDTNLQNRTNPVDGFKHVLATLRDAEVLFGNLEGPFSTPSTDPLFPDIPHKERWRHSDPSMVEGWRAAGFDAVGCANNVTYGTNAILSSLATLDAAGIRHTGVGRNRDEARRPRDCRVQGRAVRFSQLHLRFLVGRTCRR